jgi:hypothetical protein
MRASFTYPRCGVLTRVFEYTSRFGEVVSTIHRILIKNDSSLMGPLLSKQARNGTIGCQSHLPSHPSSHESCSVGALHIAPYHEASTYRILGHDPCDVYICHLPVFALSSTTCQVKASICSSYLVPLPCFYLGTAWHTTLAPLYIAPGIATTILMAE